MGSLRDTLNQLSVHYDGGDNEKGTPLHDKFETQRRNIGKAFALGNQIRELSKKGTALIPMNGEAVVEEERALRAWYDLRQLDIPVDIGWQHDGEAGQELVEFIVLRQLYPCLLGKVSLGDIKLPRHGELDMQPQTWLAGIGDVVGELGKMLDDLLCRQNMPRDDRILLRQRFIEIAQNIYDYLDQFETCYPMVINNSRRRGYGNTFRGLLGRVRGAIRHQQEALIRMLDDNSK